MTHSQCLEVFSELNVTYNTKLLCNVLEINRSSVYLNLTKKPEGKLARENRILRKVIKETHAESDGVYGAPKIHQLVLRNDEIDFPVSQKRVGKIMRKLDLHSQIMKKYRPQPSKKRIYEAGENLLKQDFSTTAINEKWVCDITYIPTQKNGWCYLASVLDLHSKKNIGWCFSQTMDKEIVMQALEAAIKAQKPSTRLIIHSDRGSQYTSVDYRNKIKLDDFQQSYSKKGCPYDNAPIESFHAILKKELIYRYQFEDYASAKRALFQYIEGFYNRKRIHSSLGYRTPQEVENSFKKSVAALATGTPLPMIVAPLRKSAANCFPL